MVTIDKIGIQLYEGAIENISKRLGIHSNFQSVRWRLFFAQNGFLRGALTSTFQGVPLFSPETPVLLDLLERLHSEDIFYDVGAYRGSYCCTVPQITGCKAVAFEPHPEKSDVLHYNCSLNNISNSVDIHTAALANENRKGELEIKNDRSADRLATDTPSETTEIEIVQGDDYIRSNGLPTPNIIKIDIEGAEVQALHGLEETISDDSLRAVYCEVHHGHISDYGDSSNEVRSLLQKAGFDIETIHSRSDEEFIRALR